MVRRNKSDATTKMSKESRTQGGGGNKFMIVIATFSFFALYRSKGSFDIAVPKSQVASQEVSSGRKAAEAPVAAAPAAVETPKKCLDLQTSFEVTDRYLPKADEEPLKCLLYTPPSEYINIIMKTIVGLPNQGKCDLTSPDCRNQLPYDPLERHYGNDWPPFG